MPTTMSLGSTDASTDPARRATFVSEWAPETLTQQHIDAYKVEGFKPISINPDIEYEHPPPPPPPPTQPIRYYGNPPGKQKKPKGALGTSRTGRLYGQNKRYDQEKKNGATAGFPQAAGMDSATRNLPCYSNTARPRLTLHAGRPPFPRAPHGPPT